MNGITISAGGDGGSGGGDSHYTHIQDNASMTWNIQHLLGKYPSVILVDNFGNDIEGQIQYIDIDNLRVLYNTACAGKAHLN